MFDKRVHPPGVIPDTKPNSNSDELLTSQPLGAPTPNEQVSSWEVI